MKGTLLRCSSVAQREAARIRRESVGQFLGSNGRSMPLIPVGRLTVVIERITNHPLMCRKVFVLVRMGSWEQRTRVSESGTENSRLIRSTMQFDVPSSCWQDRGLHLLVELHDEDAGMCGSTGIHVWKVIRGDDTHGTFPLWSASDPSVAAYAGDDNGSITSIDLSVSYCSITKAPANYATYTRSNVRQYSVHDFGVFRVPRTQSAGHERAVFVEGVMSSPGPRSVHVKPQRPQSAHERTSGIPFLTGQEEPLRAHRPPRLQWPHGSATQRPPAFATPANTPTRPQRARVCSSQQQQKEAHNRLSDDHESRGWEGGEGEMNSNIDDQEETFCGLGGLAMSRQHVSKLVVELFKRFEGERTGALQWKEVKAAIALFTSRIFSDDELTNLRAKLRDHGSKEASSSPPGDLNAPIGLKEFKSLSVHALYTAAIEAYRENSNQTPVSPPHETSNEVEPVSRDLRRKVRSTGPAQPNPGEADLQSRRTFTPTVEPW